MALLIHVASPVSDIRVWPALVILLSLGGLALVLSCRGVIQRTDRRPYAGMTRNLVLWVARAAVWGAGALTWAILVFPFLVAYEPWLTLGVLSALLAVVWWFHGRPRAGPAVFSVFPVSALLLAGVLVDHYGGASEAECRNVASLPYVRPLVDRKGLSEISGIANVVPYSIEPGPEGRLFVSLKDRADGYLPRYDDDVASNCIAVISAGDGSVLQAIPLPARGDCARPEDLHYDASTDTLTTFIVYRSRPHEVRVYDTGEGALDERVSVPFSDMEPTGITGFGEKGLIVINFNTASLWKTSLPDLAGGEFSETRAVSPVTFFAGVDSDLSGEHVIVASISGAALLVDGSTLKPVADIPIYDGCGAVLVSDSGKIAWLTGYARGNLYAYDIRGRRIAGQVSTTRTAKMITQAPDIGILFVSGYHTGELVAHRSDDLAETARLWLGGLLRPVVYDARGKRLIVGSSCGILEVDLEEWRRHW